jgi:hypothetical protein
VENSDNNAEELIMLFYLLLFLITAALFFISGKLRGMLHIVFTILALLVPCVVAACRDATVGTDLSQYGLNDFNLVSANGFFDGLSVLLGYQQPFGYSLVTTIDVLLFHSLPIHLFILQALTIVPVYMATRRFAGREYVWVGMLWYMTMLYPSSLNIMKQMIAVAFLTLAIGPIVKGKKIEFLLWVAIAYSFHQTAVLFIALYPLCRLILTSKKLRLEESTEDIASRLDRYRGLWFRAWLLMAVSSVFAIIVVSGDRILNIFASLKESYEYSSEHAGENSVSIFHLILLIVLLGVGLVFYFETFANDTIQTDPSGDCNDSMYTKRLDFMFFTLTFVGLLLEQSVVITENFYRFAFYGMVFGGLYFARKAVEQRYWGLPYRYLFWMMSLVMLAAQLVLFYKIAVVAGGDAIVPYTSRLLGISIS